MKRTLLTEGVVRYTNHSGWLIGGLAIPVKYLAKIIKYEGKKVKIILEVQDD